MTQLKDKKRGSRPGWRLEDLFGREQRRHILWETSTWTGLEESGKRAGRAGMGAVGATKHTFQ